MAYYLLTQLTNKMCFLMNVASGVRKGAIPPPVRPGLHTPLYGSCGKSKGDVSVGMYSLKKSGDHHLRLDAILIRYGMMEEYFA